MPAAFGYRMVVPSAVPGADECGCVPPGEAGEGAEGDGRQIGDGRPVQQDGGCYLGADYVAGARGQGSDQAEFGDPEAARRGAVMIITIGLVILIAAVVAGVADKGPSSFVRAGEFVIRAAMSWPRARISDPACLVCAAKQSSPAGERMVRAQ